MKGNVLRTVTASEELESATLEYNLNKNITDKCVDEKNKKFQNNVEERNALKQNAKIPVCIIQSCVSNHISQVLTNDAYQIISDYCSQKLTQVIKSSVDSMKFCGRSKLSIADFNRGLYINEEKLLMKQKFLPVQRGGKRKRKDISISYYNYETENNNLQPVNVDIDNKWLKNSNPFSTDIANLPTEFQKYFDVVTKVLLIKNGDMCSKVIQDLKTNNCILSLVPYFVNFFSYSVNKLSHDFSRMSVFLKAMYSFLSNSYLYFSHRSFLNVLAYTILKFLVADIPYSDHGWDCWSLKDMAGSLLVQILKRNESNELFFEVVYNLESVFCDFRKSLVSHYGAVVALNSVGVPAIMLAISPHINKYYEHINLVYASEFQKRHDVAMVQGQLIHSHYLLIQYYFKYEYNVSSAFSVQHYLHLPFYYVEFLKHKKVLPFLSQSWFSDFFGDTLVQHFPLLDHIPYDVNYKKKNVNMKHFSYGVRSPRKASQASSKLASTSVVVWGNLSKKDIKPIKSTNVRNKIFFLKAGYSEKVTPSISEPETLFTKNIFKGSTDQIFEVVSLKKCTIRFGKIKGVPK